MPSLSDLLRMGKQYISDALPGGSLNPEVSRQSVLDGAAMALSPVPLLGDLVGLGADANRYATDPESRTPMNYGLTALGALPFVPGMTAWHGSPHKFDKFSLDKIGTGEGAQAYGHGLYLAESPEVARSYAEPASKGWDKDVFYKGQPLTASTPYEKTALDYFQTSTPMPSAPKRVQEAIATLESQVKLFDRLKSPSDSSNAKMAIEYLRGLDPSMIEVATKKSNLYKTDIPDEAVARFLDWDKPVPEDLRQMISKKAMEQFGSGSTGTSGEHLYKEIARELGNPAVKNASPDASAWLAANGIPGIRYLDGGSRPTGQVDKQLLSMLDKHGGDPVAAVDDFMRFVHNTPAKKASMRDQFLKELQQNRTSNFVAFDPEMIRILERNGQATGLEPWKPGEYRLKDLIGKE